MRWVWMLLPLLLGSCGGSGSAPGLSATLVVTATGQPELGGTYVATSLQLSDVTRMNALDPNFDSCGFSFSGLQLGAMALQGNVAYAPTSPTRPTLQLRSVRLIVSGIEFDMAAGPGAAIDMASLALVFSGAVLSNPGTSASVTVAGSIPLPGTRAAGC